MASLGGFSFTTSFPRHGWGELMNRNFLKMAMLLQPTVRSMSTPLPSGASDYDAYIDPDTRQINMWFGGEWNTITPVEGALIYVADIQSYVHYSDTGQWRVAVNLNSQQPSIPQSLAVYVPGAIRPEGPVYRYVAAIEFTLRSGAEGCKASLDIAPSGGSVTFNVAGGGKVGTFTFAEGSTVGSFSLPEDIIVHPMENESPTAGGSAGLLTITAPSDLFGAEGLAVSLRGEVRPLHEG